MVIEAAVPELISVVYSTVASKFGAKAVVDWSDLVSEVSLSDVTVASDAVTVSIIG